MMDDDMTQDAAPQEGGEESQAPEAPAEQPAEGGEQAEGGEAPAEGGEESAM